MNACARCSRPTPPTAAGARSPTSPARPCSCAVTTRPTSMVRPCSSTAAGTRPRATDVLDSGLAGRTCLVTGAANGIGRAVAQLLAGEEARLALADLDATALDALPARDGDLRVAADLSRRDEVQRTLAAVREQHGRLDVLIHCAGVYRTSK